MRDKTTGKYPDWIKPYKVVERDGDRIFVTGFCIDRLPSKALNVDVIPQEEAFDGLIADIEREKPDAIIVIKQIYLDGAPLFDEKGEAIEPNRKISCAFDNFIPTDGRSEILQNANKEDVIIGGKKLRINDTLIYQLKSAQGKYEKGATYPKFELVETID